MEVFKSRQRWRERSRGRGRWIGPGGRSRAGGPTPSTRSAQPVHKYSMNHCELISFLKNTIFFTCERREKSGGGEGPSPSPKLKTDEIN